MQTITIELRIDFDTIDKEVKEKVMMQLARQAAKELLASAAMIAGKRAPRISLQCGDFFAYTENVELFDGDEV